MSDSRNERNSSEQSEGENKKQTTDNATNVGGHSTDGKNVNKANPEQWATGKDMNNPNSSHGVDQTTSGHENWKNKKMKLKVKFPNLTDTDLHFEVGKKEEMLTKIRSKIGKTKSELDTIIDRL